VPVQGLEDAVAGSAVAPPALVSCSLL